MSRKENVLTMAPWRPTTACWRRRGLGLLYVGCRQKISRINRKLFPCLLDGEHTTLSTSRSVERGTGAFIYAQSAVENRAALAAPRHTSTALFSCRFKCPCPPRRQRHFHGNADRAYNTLHFAPQSRVPNGALPPLETPATNRCYAPSREHSAVCCQQPVSRSACSSL